jgi:hypothetical protein
MSGTRVQPLPHDASRTASIDRRHTPDFRYLERALSSPDGLPKLGSLVLKLAAVKRFTELSHASEFSLVCLHVFTCHPVSVSVT